MLFRIFELLTRRKPCGAALSLVGNPATAPEPKGARFRLVLGGKVLDLTQQFPTRPTSHALEAIDHHSNFAEWRKRTGALEESPREALGNDYGEQ